MLGKLKALQCATCIREKNTMQRVSKQALTSLQKVLPEAKMHNFMSTTYFLINITDLFVTHILAANFKEGKTMRGLHE